jgi:hypothetical protein
VMFDPIMLHIMYEKGFIKTDKEAWWTITNAEWTSVYSDIMML